jgi:hypothetical protein
MFAMDFVPDERKNLILLVVVFQKLLGNCLGGTKGCNGRWRRDFIGPNGDQAGGTCWIFITDRDTAGIDKEIELVSAKEGYPVRPLHASGDAGGIEGARR